MIRVNVKGIAYDESNIPIVLLADNDEEKILPIWIGMMEAHSIALAIENQEVPRPLTHDLMLNLCTSMGVSMTKVIISDLRDNTFFAELHMLKEDEDLHLDARPSDAIALALRTHVPIYITEKIENQMMKIQDLIEESGSEETGELSENIFKDDKKSLH